MRRRNFLNYAVPSAATTLVLAACSPRSSEPTPTASTPSQPSIRWRMATSWPKSVDITFNTAELLCQRVNRMTNGRFVITPYAADEVVPGLKVLQAVQNKTVECGHTAGYYYVKQNVALAFGTAVPFGLNAQQQNAWMFYGGGLEALRKLYADFGIINFPGGSTGAQMGGWFRKEIQSVTDLKGLKMRIPGLGGKVMAQLGVQVQVLLGREIFEALEQGKVDAAEWVGPYDDEKLGLNRVAPFYYSPGWWEPGTTYEFQVNLEQWNQLPSEYREIFQAAAAEAHLKMVARYDAANTEALKRLILTGTKLRSLTPAILQAAYKAAFALYEDTARTDPVFREIYQGWKTFRSQVYEWHRVNELGFAQFAFDQP